MNYCDPATERSIVMTVSVCLSVCLSVRGHISGTTRPLHQELGCIPKGKSIRSSASARHTAVPSTEHTDSQTTLRRYVCSSRRRLQAPTSIFHRAMVATAPGEKLLIGRRRVRSWTRRTISSLFVRRKLHLFLGKSTKTAATRAALLDSNMHPNRLSAGALPQTHALGELTALPQTP